LPIALPAIVIGGYALTIGAGGVIEDAWDNFVGPFLITYWIGLGFTNTWDMIKDSLHGARPLTLAVVGIGGSLFLLGMLGGPGVLLEEPWLFGAVVAPGLELLRPVLSRGPATRTEN
jgi:hypothetical protein